MWQRSKHDRVLCPLISIARFSDIPIFSTMFRTWMDSRNLIWRLV
jgi:hypothetical protein